MNKEYYSVAIDGPAGAGKSTIAKGVAKTLNLEYIDTGAMFRAFTLKVLQNNIDIKDNEKIIELIDKTEIDFIDGDIYLDGTNVNKEIRHNEVSMNASFIAKIKEVRDMMLRLQRDMANKKSVIMDGRDIGTVILPNAKYKFYLTATAEERARRRYSELIEKGEKDISLEEIKEDIIKRDKMDSSREIAPLKKAEDAVLVDTTNIGIEEAVETIVSTIVRR